MFSSSCETCKGFLLKKVKVCCLSGLKMDRTISRHFWISCFWKIQSLSLFQAYLSAHVSKQVLAKDPTSFMNLEGAGDKWFLWFKHINDLISGSSVEMKHMTRTKMTRWRPKVPTTNMALGVKYPVYLFFLLHAFLIVWFPQQLQKISDCL